MTVFAKFLAFEAVGWVLAAALLYWLVSAEIMQAWMGGVLFGAWVVKDLVLFPLTRKAYEHGPTHGSADLLGAEVRVETLLAPEGYVSAGHERWMARLAPDSGPLEPGDLARVCALEGITLVVEPSAAVLAVSGRAVDQG